MNSIALEDQGLALRALLLLVETVPFHLACSPLDRNLTAIGCLSLSLPVRLGEQYADKGAFLSLPDPYCLSLSVKENDYEQRRSQVRVLPSAPLKVLQKRDFFQYLRRPRAGGSGPGPSRRR